SITRPSKYRSFSRHLASAPMNSEASMSKQSEKVLLPFDEGGVDAPGADAPIQGALALSLAKAPGAGETAEGAAYVATLAAAWGITVPADFTPATKAQVAYWREVCGTISLMGKIGMRDGAWPAELTPSKSTLATMTERGLIVRRGRAWRLTRK